MISKHSSIFNQTLNKLHLKVSLFLSSSRLQAWTPVWEREAKLSPLLPHCSPGQEPDEEEVGKGAGLHVASAAALWAGWLLWASHTYPLGNFPRQFLDAGEPPPSHHLGPGFQTLPYSVLLESPDGKSLTQGGSCLSLSHWPVSRTVEHCFFCLPL